ncbi:MAG TPA: hypothetical protein VFW93_13740 [Aquabacterium sp.]|uniref:hypothetical protein n=1 Tax=Aquabacterium sp. TaxID=1872578 RepID=UPI002E33F417|nr:hypothetical protein [Aquabacterium sp.]HEX5357276.1 hypothetical protein [Aquabacterium sp.]
MIDVQTMWRRIQGRWTSLRQVPALYLFAPTSGTEDMALALSAFAQWCEAHPGVRCRVGLSGCWLLHSVPGPTGDAQSAQALALQQWAHYLDLDESTLLRDWVLREVAVSKVALVCAVPRSLIEGLHEQATAHGVRLEWVGPWWAQGVQFWLADLAADVTRPEGIRTLHLVEPDLVTHVQATGQPGKTASLQRIWSDRHDASRLAPGDGRVVLQAPASDGQANTAVQHGLWDHTALQPVLSGVDSCWKAQA